MKLVTVEAAFAPADLDAAMTLLAAQADAVRAMPGCVSYALYRGPSGDRVAIVQRWLSAGAFDAYRASETFARLGAGLGPLMTAPPQTIVAEVDTL